MTTRGFEAYEIGCPLCGSPEPSFRGTDAAGRGLLFCNEVCEELFVEAVTRDAPIESTFFRAERGRNDLVWVSVLAPDPSVDPYCLGSSRETSVAVAVLPPDQAIEWLAGRGCLRFEAKRIVGQLARTLFSESTGAVPTLTEWVLGSPVEREGDE